MDANISQVKSAEQELAECSFQPRINYQKETRQDSLRERLGTFQLLFEQSQRPKQNIETLRQMLEEQELSELRPVPEINEISRKIVEARREVYSMSNKENLNTSNTLYEESKILQERKKCRQQIEYSRFPFHPTINKNSNCFVKLLGKGFYERVEQDLRKREKLQGRGWTQQVLYEHEKELSLCYDDKTGQQLFQPDLKRHKQPSSLNSHRLSQSLDYIKPVGSPQPLKKHNLKPSSALSSKIGTTSEKPGSAKNLGQTNSRVGGYNHKHAYLKLDGDSQHLPNLTEGTRSTRTSQIQGKQAYSQGRGAELPQIREVSSAHQLKETLRQRFNQKTLGRAGHSNSTDSIGLPSRALQVNRDNLNQNTNQGNTKNRLPVSVVHRGHQDNASLISVETATHEQQVHGYHEFPDHSEFSQQQRYQNEMLNQRPHPNDSLLNFGRQTRPMELNEVEGKDQTVRLREIHDHEALQERRVDLSTDFGRAESKQSVSPVKKAHSHLNSSQAAPSSNPSLRHSKPRLPSGPSRGHQLRSSNTPVRSRDSKVLMSRDERSSGHRRDFSASKSAKSSRHSSCSRETGTCVELQSVSGSSYLGIPEINHVSKELAEEKEKSAVQHIFELLDSDGDGMITPDLICLDLLSSKQLKIMSPLLFELEDLNQTLNSAEFLEAMQLLCKGISINEKRDLLYAPPRQFVDENLTFQVDDQLTQPAINPTSRDLAVHRRPSESAGKNLYDIYKPERDQFYQKIDEQRREREAAALQGCTFRPDTSLSKGWLKQEGISREPALLGRLAAPRMGRRDPI